MSRADTLSRIIRVNDNSKDYPSDAAFYGIKADGSTDDTAAVQAYMTAVGNAGGGTVQLPPGTIKVTSALSMAQPNVYVRGAGRKATILNQVTTSSAILSVTGDYFGLSGLSLQYNTTPINGATAIFTQGSYGGYHDFHIANAWAGVEVNLGASNKFNDFDIRDYESVGIYCHSMNDAFFSQFVLDAELPSRGVIGGIRLYNQCEAVIFSDGDVIRGSYGLSMDAAANTERLRPASCEFIGVHFDSALTNNAYLNNTADIDFSACWFSYAGFNGVGTPVASPGVLLGTVDDIRFNGGRAVTNWAEGVQVTANAKRVRFDGFTARENGLKTSNTYPGIKINAGASDFAITGCSLGGGATLYNASGVQNYGVQVLAGGSDRYIIADNLVSGNGTGGVSDGGTGVNKRVANNY